MFLIPEVNLNSLKKNWQKEPTIPRSLRRRRSTLFTGCLSCRACKFTDSYVCCQTMLIKFYTFIADGGFTLRTFLRRARTLTAWLMTPTIRRNTMGSPMYPAGTNHFSPYSPLFKKEQRKYIQKISWDVDSYFAIVQVFRSSCPMSGLVLWVLFCILLAGSSSFGITWCHIWWV